MVSREYFAYSAIMKFAVLLVLVSAVSLGSPQQSSRTLKGTPAVCEAAAPKLRETGTNQVVLVMTISVHGHVLSFKTEAPKGLRLEKIKKAADEIKAMRLTPATKDGKPVTAMIRFSFQCP